MASITADSKPVINNNVDNTNSIFNRIISSNLMTQVTDKIPILKNQTFQQISILVIVWIILILVIIGINKIVVYFYMKSKTSPWIIKKTKNAKNSLVISQDPENENSITLNRSSGENGGIEYSYSFWLLIENYIYKKGEWKHIFHKGNSTSYPNRAPGVWLHPNQNSLRVYMKTYENILEFIDIDNVPIKKWIHIGITLEQKMLDVYINGVLKKRHVLSSLPRQNFGDLWINLFGGFEGFMSKMRYFQKTLTHSEIEDIVSDGPSLDTCGDSGEIPPYLNDNWWHKN